MEDLRIRQPKFADGMWYSATAAQLETSVQTYLDDAPTMAELGEIVGLVAPHAGHHFSGHVAGAGFGQLSHTYENVVLIGPDHRGAAMGQVATPDVEAWQTPLGDIPVNRDFLQTLDDELSLRYLHADQEHALEIELPFLQLTLKTFKLIPLIMGSQSSAMCRQLAHALISVIQSGRFGSTLLVASSDLSHFYDDATARQLDEISIQFMLNLDGDGLTRHAESSDQRASPCGTGPVATVIHTAKALSATRATLIKYATSGDIHPDKSQVVGYAAVVFSK